MTWLVIDTATSACSVALLDGGTCRAARHEIIDRGHAERLVPMIAEVMREAGVDRAGAVAVDVGPGSFTGLRVGIAAARALGLAWDVPVTGFHSTALVAAGARAAGHHGPLAVAIDALRGEVYFEMFDGLASRGAVEAVAPAEAARRAAGMAVAGSGAKLLCAADSRLTGIDPLWPCAADAGSLPPDARALQPRPLYVRAPDAKLPGGLAASAA